MSELRNYFSNQEEIFNQEEPPEGHFDRFLDKLENEKKTKKLKFTFLLKVASIVVLVLLSSLWVVDNVFIKTPDGIRLQDISKEYEEVEFFYATMVSNKIHELKSSELFDETQHKKLVSSELKELDSLYKVLQVELQVNPNDERIINAMIHHYQLKVDVLSRIIEHLNAKSNNKEKNIEYENI